MIAEKFIRIARGLAKAIIPIKKLHLPAETGGTTDSSYCYSTWLRHLMLLNKYQQQIPAVVAELGPGDSLGTGIAALLCGCEKYVALDMFTYGSPENNVKIFDELVILFSNKTRLPDEIAFPMLIPRLDNYDFPAHILTEEILATSMAAERLAAIRDELASPSPANIFVQYFVPWQANDIESETVDFIFSQSVLQYTNLDTIYKSTGNWLKPNGMMAHVIDFSSLGSATAWNGHWAYTFTEWKLFGIGKKMLINRAPLSYHKNYLEKYNFNLLNTILYKKTAGLQKQQLATPFRLLANDDVETHAGYMLAVKVN